jgi:monoamine oxidase
VRVSAAPSRCAKQRIDELGYGSNAKLIGQFHERPWLTRHHANGSAFTDLAWQACWDTSRAQPGDRGVLTLFVGGAAGRTLDRGTPDARMREWLPELDVVFPGTAPAYMEDSALRMHWPSMPWALGSYACYRPGQAAWAGLEGARVGRMHFCGEHTSPEFQGYLEGAAAAGERVATEILRDLGRNPADV